MYLPFYYLYYMGCCVDCLTCDSAFNAVMSLSCASTRGSYSRIEGVTIMYFDGVFSLHGAGAGVLLVAPTGEHLKYVIQMHFPREVSTNNTTEYEGLLAGLRIAADLGIKKPIVRGDSQLVIKQVNKDY